MRERDIREALDEYATQQLLKIGDPWPAIRRAATPLRPLPKQGRTRQVPRLGLLLPVLLLVLLFATAGGVGLARTRWFSSWMPPHGTLQRLGQLHAVDQSQVIAGYTITLRYAYADANVILLETIIRDPAGHLAPAVQPTWHLTDQRGIVLPQVFDSGAIAVDPGVPGQYATFNAAMVRDTVQTLPLRLTLTFMPGAPASAPALHTPDAAISQHSAYAPATPMVVPATARTGSLPAVFTFTVPFSPGIVLRPQQTVRAVDLPLTLRQIIVTTAETRAIVCYTPAPGTARDHWLIIADDGGKKVPGGEDQLGLAAEGVQSATGGEHCGVFHLAGQERKTGTRQLRITEVSWGQTAGETRVTGPWLFHYTLP